MPWCERRTKCSMRRSVRGEIAYALRSCLEDRWSRIRSLRCFFTPRNREVILPACGPHTPLVRVKRNLSFEECMAFEKAAKLSEIPPGSIKEVQVGGQAIALANV